MNREGPVGTLPSAQMLACGRPEANLICMLSVRHCNAWASRGKQEPCQCSAGKISIQKKTPEELERARRMQKCIPSTRMIHMESRDWRAAEPKRLPVFSGHATD